MKLAAIDIGSNAVRLQITNVISYGDNITFKKLQYIRFPLRLGADVFTLGKLSEETCERFVELMRSFKILIDLYEVDDFYACATSAMREAQNGAQLIQRVKAACDLNIDIITGEREADLINRVISFHLDESTYLHVDVGGGSTELNLYREQEKVASKSFPIGTVRALSEAGTDAAWEALDTWITEHVNTSEEHVTAIGTGGNINKLFELANGIGGKHLSIKKLKDVRATLKNMALEDRIYKLQLNADRADVIVPASRIYITVMVKAGATKILVPDVGLKDGIVTYLYEKNKLKKGHLSFKNS